MGVAASTADAPLLITVDDSHVIAPKANQRPLWGNFASDNLIGHLQTAPCWTQAHAAAFVSAANSSLLMPFASKGNIREPRLASRKSTPPTRNSIRPITKQAIFPENRARGPEPYTSGLRGMLSYTGIFPLFPPFSRHSRYVACYIRNTDSELPSVCTRHRPVC